MQRLAFLSFLGIVVLLLAFTAHESSTRAAQGKVKCSVAARK